MTALIIATTTSEHGMNAVIERSAADNRMAYLIQR